MRIGFAFVVLAIAGLAVALTSSRSDATSVPSLSDTFSVLKSKPGPAAEVATGTQQWLGTLAEFGGPAQGPSEIGVADTAAGEEVVVAGGDETICFHSVQTGLSNCAEAHLAASGNVYSATADLASGNGGCDAWQVIGVVPDGVSALKVDAPGAVGDPSTIPVTSNIYSAKLAPVATTLSGDGVSITVPLDKYAAGAPGC